MKSNNILMIFLIEKIYLCFLASNLLNSLKNEFQKRAIFENHGNFSDVYFKTGFNFKNILYLYTVKIISFFTFN